MKLDPEEPFLKVSIVTAVYNRESVIAHAVQSVRAQGYRNLEHVIIDGASTDGTLATIQSCVDQRAVVFSEPDKGIYDALNKGFARATGDIVGIVHSDDFLADDRVLADIVQAFADAEVDAVYGDLDYVSQDDDSHVVRHWSAGRFDRRQLHWGWMPPHPTLFIRRSAIDRLGAFDTGYRISADYDLVLRYFCRGEVRPAYIPRVLVKMRVGGASNRSLQQMWLKSSEDWRALRRNRVGAFGGVGALIWKNLRKVRQFL